MPQWMSDNTALLSISVGVSVVLVIASVIAAPIVLTRIPADYFSHEHRPKGKESKRAWIRVTVRIVRNALGVLLILAGIAMLALPGQGLLTLLVGLMLVEFPGKYRAERWLVCRPPVRKAIGWVRKRAGKPPLELESCD